MNLFSSKNWKTTTLDEVLDLIGGGTPKTTVEEYWNGEIPWLSVVDFNNDSRWVYRTEKTITQEGLQKSSTKLLNEGDIIISARGTVGALAQLAKPMSFNQSCYGIRAKENFDQNFIFYLIKSAIPHLTKNVHGAVFDTLTRESFSSVVVSVPESLTEQKEIADLLGSFDKKIELLRKQNQTLESMAQVLFKEWFVDFRYPGATGKMVKSEMGMIPEGWRVGKLGEILSLQGGFVHNTKAEGKENVRVAKMGVVDGKGWFNRDSVFVYSEHIPEKYKLNKDDLLICTRDVTQDKVVIGNVAIVPEDLSRQGLYAGSNTWIIKTDFNRFFLFLLFRSRDFREHIIQSSKGSTIVMITKDVFLNREFLLPPDFLLKSLMSKINPFFEAIKNNSLEIQTLSKMQDELLNQIFSG